MNQHYNQNSFDKGQAFENFVENILFPKSHYELLHKTNAYDQNSQRYVGDSRNPDFRFKCILTGFEFHVEAKYRSKPYMGFYDILSPAQIISFPEIHTTECPVFIALGYGHIASDPSFVSFIPYQTHEEPKIPVEDVFFFNVNKEPLQNEVLVGYIHKEIKKDFQEEIVLPIVESVKEETVYAAIDNQKKSHTSKSTFTGLALGLAVLIGVCTGIFLFPWNKEEEYKQDMKTRVKNYYILSDANNIKELQYYISSDMTYWYGIKEPTLDQITENIKAYRNKFPFSESTVVWKEFDVTKREEGGFYATYPLVYKVKSKLQSPFRSYNLKLLTIWDDEMKLLSVREIRK